MTEKPKDTTTSTTGKFNPLEEKVNEKGYTSQGGQTPNNNIPLPEPVFTPPNLGGGAIPSSDNSKDSKSQAQTQQQQAPKPFNPALQNASPTDKYKSAEQTATFFMNQYKMLHGFGNFLLQISDDKINKMAMSGEVDTSVAVPYDYGKFVTLDEFIKEYNKQAGETLVVEKEFEEAVMPALTRVLEKRGHGMTDEQFLLFTVSQDIGIKGFKFYQMKKQTKDILAFAREQSAAAHKRPVQPQTQPMEEQSQPRPQQPADSGAKIVPMTQAQSTQTSPQATTVQQQAVDRVVVQQSTNQTELPKFGQETKLTTLGKIYEDELSQKKKDDKVRAKLHGTKSTVPTSRKSKGLMPMPGIKGKRKPGRPKGSTKKK